MKQKSNVLAIAIMFFLFAMISFVTGLSNPMGVIVKAQFGVSNFASQLGNAANFIAYLFMGLPAGLILKKYGYKVTALIAVAVGLIGVGVEALSGVAGAFGVYLLGAFIAGFSMCLLNTVVNPMLNTLGGGGNRGNQLIQYGGTLNSLSATCVPVFVGYLIADASKATIPDAYPALFIAMGVFAVSFVIILISSIPEPELEARKANPASAEEGTVSSIKHALQHKNLIFGVIAIFLYVGIEMGIPNISNLYLTAPVDGIVAVQEEAPECCAAEASEGCCGCCAQAEEAPECCAEEAAPAEGCCGGCAEEAAPAEGCCGGCAEEEVAPEGCCGGCCEEPCEAEIKPVQPGAGIPAAVAGTVIGIYWLLMLVGRFLGASIGGKVSPRAQMIFVSALGIVLLLIGMNVSDSLVPFPTITADLSFGMTEVPLGVVFFMLCGLCTSIMWGSIFNLAVEGLGKYTSIASGLFMVMVVGGGVLPLISGAVADACGYLNSYWVLIVALAYILWFAIFGSKPNKVEE